MFNLLDSGYFHHDEHTSARQPKLKKQLVIVQVCRELDAASRRWLESKLPNFENTPRTRFGAGNGLWNKLFGAPQWRGNDTATAAALHIHPNSGATSSDSNTFTNIDATRLARKIKSTLHKRMVQSRQCTSYDEKHM
ncbi:hypothetical protein FB451DRAFT_1171216 [Mycena latifolia]|nr:hypothetical protein FB451DRAFT_1171216 [Mycena latifolia]